MLSKQQQAYAAYPAEGYMTVDEYGRHRNCSTVNIYKAIKEGRLEGAVMIDSLNRKNINQPLADTLWEKTDTVHGVMQRERRRREKMGGGYDGPRRPPEGEEDEDTSSDPNILEAKRRNEWIKVELNTLVMDEKKGKLIDADQVRREQFEMARTIRENMMALPDRLAAKFSAERDERKIHADLSLEIRKALKACQAIIREGFDK